MGFFMPETRVLGIIPARIGSERLPRKPLHLIAGRPLLQWVWERARAIPTLDRVVIATDSPEIAAAAGEFGADVRLTSTHHPSGTDRAAEVAALPEFRDFGVLVNVQGDEPFVTDEQVAQAVALVRAGWDVGTVATPLRSLAAWRDPGVVKVVRADDGAALYFSRAPIPAARGRTPTAAELAAEPFLRHVGLYAFARKSLGRWVALPPATLEQLERLEQLRPLTSGLRIGVAVTAHAEGGIDTLEDALRAERRLTGRSRAATTSTVIE
jgi:3-deoxy-manno-octulosonate cytidylyltransferase (CMP-KDO synthetase)